MASGSASVPSVESTFTGAKRKSKDVGWEWAYEYAIPFHAFEKDSFKMLLEVVGQFGTMLPPPTRCELSIPLLKEEDGYRFLSSKECSGEAHTSEYIYEYVDACIQEVGDEHVVQIVTDNASNNMGAAALLKVTRPKIFWTSCTINLMLEGIGALQRFKKILDQAKKLTIFIYSHHKTLAMTRDFTKKRDIVRPGVKRFASSFLTSQSLSEKKEQLRHMFSSTEWEECRFFGTIKGKAAYATQRKKSKGFWVVTKSLRAYHKNHREEDERDLEMQMQVTNVEMPKYKKQRDRFGKQLAISTCEVNNERYDPANWWGSFGGATPNLKKIAMRILSLTSSSSGCERNWSTFEGIHTKKRNRLEASKLNNLGYVQFNSNLTERAKGRKARDVEVLLSNDSNMAQEWMVECDGDGNRNRDEEVEVQDQQDQEAHWEVIGEAMEADEYLQPR
uniref:HAT C-terminal dimerisation domain-containing protein n=1 Tax=Tanacetum cinerariifolium TaxID=118510 RepID=A0A6L2KN67_TANCI|nr:hypothetical protein [Tanacetum cinerariifolium]